MHKLILALTLITFLVLLGSCPFGIKEEGNNLLGGLKTDMFKREDEGKLAAARLEDIIEAITNKDKDMIKQLFSEQALSEAENLDLEIEYLFNLIDGNIESWDKIGGSVDESLNYGRTVKQYRYRFNAYTSKEQYLFSILEFLKDSDNPQNVGVYCLKIINIKDEEPIFSDAGIYMPK